MSSSTISSANKKSADDITAQLPNDKILAAVDIGSNSIHLIVARIVHGALQPIQRYRERVQLAAGLDSDGVLDESAQLRGVNCLEKMGKLLDDHCPDSFRAVATFTVRSAKNRNQFLCRAEKALGRSIDVISGREEARLIFQGVAHDQTLSENALVIDIGGGSTELAVGAGYDPQFKESCNMGCVSFAKLFFGQGVTKKSFDKAYRYALQALEKYLFRLSRLQWSHVFATSGTAKALARLMTDSAGGRRFIEIAQLRDIKKRLLSEKDLSWLLDAGIDEDRMHLVPGGLAIMLAVLDTLEIDQVRYKDVALREGVLYEMDEQMRHPSVRQRTRLSLQSLYQVDSEHATRVATTVTEILENIGGEWLPDLPTQVNDILLEAAHLHEVGVQISANGSQRHSAYILINSDLPGYNQDQQQLLSELVRWYRKRIRLEEFSELRLIDAVTLSRMIFVLRFAVLINITRSPVALSEIQFALQNGMPSCIIDDATDSAYPLLSADLIRERDYLKVLDISLNLNI